MPEPGNKNIVVIGAGAAGFFCSINIALKSPSSRILIIEKTNKVLSKVRISGGGRCNVTNAFLELSELAQYYPRGNKELRQVLTKFGMPQTVAWFKEQRVELKTEPDGRMFPVTDNSETIINCFLNLSRQLNISIRTSEEVFAVKKNDTGFQVKTSKEVLNADIVVCSSGGHPKAESYNLVRNLGHTIMTPIPSLFTFNLPAEEIKNKLQGVSINNAHIKIKGTKMEYAGPLLITHWGLSGPAVLKLSAFAAQLFSDLNYESQIIVNWVYPQTLTQVTELLKKIRIDKSRSLPASVPSFGLPKRLWEFLCNTSELLTEKTWADVNNAQLNKLAAALTENVFQMRGKTTFKEEFVTSGGVKLSEVDFKSMQSKLVPGLYFCGEVLNIDGITGGFNFQAAWSTAYAAASAITRED